MDILLIFIIKKKKEYERDRHVDRASTRKEKSLLPRNRPLFSRQIRRHCPTDRYERHK